MLHHPGEQHVAELRDRHVGPGHIEDVATARVEGAADARRLVLVAPGAAEPFDHLGLDVVPDRFGVDQQPVHVEQNSLGPTHLALKYFASGWCTTIASVACSGCSWNSSDKVTPIRS